MYPEPSAPPALPSSPPPPATRWLEAARAAPDGLLDDLPDEAWDEEAELCVVATVRYREGARAFDCDAGDLVVRRGDRVVVAYDGRSQALGTVSVGSHRRLVRQRLPRVLRLAHEGDLRAESTRRLRENDAAREAAALVSELEVETKVVRAEASVGGGRMVVYLTSEERVDTRELLRRLASVVPGRVEIRQVGARDAAAYIGGVGPCGLQLCCNTFLADFAPVSIRMAKDQGLPLHPGRVHGVCGRLLCCLVYEHDLYKAERKRFPKIGKVIETPDGLGRLIDIDVLAERVSVALADAPGLRTFRLAEIRVPPPAAPSAPERELGDAPLRPRSSRPRHDVAGPDARPDARPEHDATTAGPEHDDREPDPPDVGAEREDGEPDPPEVGAEHDDGAATSGPDVPVRGDAAEPADARDDDEPETAPEPTGDA